MLDRGSDALKDFHYYVDRDTIAYRDASVSFTLRLPEVCHSIFFANKLDVQLTFYQNGIMQTLITEPDTPSAYDVFRTSTQDGVLTPENLIKVTNLEKRARLDE